MEACFECRGLSKRFGNVQALDEVNISIMPGRVVGLLGPNGSGKTTLMNMLSGIYFPDEGQILIDGEEVVIRSPRDAYRYGIGMIHQHYKLVDVFTAAENIVLGLDEPGKLDIKAANARVKEICDRYGFDIDPTKKIYDMSVSQKQTVEIVKVLFRGADILILDEPTRGIDVGAKYDIYCLINQMVEQGKSVIMISSEIPEIVGRWDPSYIMNEGKFVGEVSKEEATSELIMSRIVKSGKGA